MFENYKQMSADEKAQVKAIHKAVRKEASSRQGNLAWAYMRGLPYRRVERTTRSQTMADGSVVNHNPPPLLAVAHILVAAIPSLASELLAGKFQLKPECPLTAWAKDPSGAIAAPAPRAKKPFTREAVA
jgi:uncharacterized heparinase superfamily protein